MYPSREKEYAGVFVKNQYEFLELHDNKNVYKILALPRSFTGFWGSIKKYAAFYFHSMIFLFREKFDIIHLHYFYPLLPIVWVFKKLTGSRIVITVHGSDLYEKMTGKYIIRFYKYLLKQCDVIICVGDQLKNDFERVLQIPVSEVLCAGVDKAKFYPINSIKEYDFIYVGSLINRKGFDIVLKTIESLIIDGASWCVVGSGPYEQAIKELESRFPSNIHYVKNIAQKDLNILYNKSKWFFFPARNEPFGLVASESVFAGTPIICSRNGGLNEQIVEGVNGFALSDITNIQELLLKTTIALNLEEGKYSKMVDSCKQTNKQFSLDHVCNRLMEIYEGL